MKLFILKNPCLFFPFLDLCLECWQTKVCWASDGHILRAAWQCLHVAWHVGIELRILTFLQAHSLRCLPRSQVSSENLLPQRKHFLLTLSSLLEKKSNKFNNTWMGVRSLLKFEGVILIYGGLGISFATYSYKQILIIF